eukprot:7699561-Alexandrium_andersonii.AAC.1
MDEAAVTASPRCEAAGRALGLPAHAEPRRPDDGNRDHRNDPGNNDGEASFAGGVRARAPATVVGAQ